MIYFNPSMLATGSVRQWFVGVMFCIMITTADTSFIIYISLL